MKRTCLTCGSPVLDYRPPSESVLSTGQRVQFTRIPARSLYLIRNDKGRLFCTLRCAALHGIREATRHGL